MGRHRLPVEVQQLKGADKENPNRYAAHVPKSEVTLGDAPTNFDREEMMLWEDIVSALPEDMLTRLDRQLLKTTVRLCVHIDRTPMKEVAASKVSLMVQCLARLGFTPADRRKLGTNEPPISNDFTQFDS